MTGPLVLYESRLLDAVPVASSTAAGFDVLNLRDARAYTFYKPASMPFTVTVDCGSSKNVDYWAIYGHDLFTTGCTIELRKSTDNFAANDVLVDTHTPGDNKPILRLITSTGSRYWRLRGLTGTAPTLAIAMLGVRLEVPAGVREGFDPIGRNEISQFNRSIKGHALGIVTDFAEWKESLFFELVSWTWVRDTWAAAWDAWLKSEPWLFSWNPDTYPKETFLVVRDGQFSTPHKSGSFADLQVPVTGVIP
jgi:hypothetical protein